MSIKVRIPSPLRNYTQGVDIVETSGATVGDHFRFIGIEWTTPPEANIGRLVAAENTDHVIFDRNWVHPANGAEVGHGIGMVHGSHTIAVINSYISGLNCIADRKSVV